MSIASYLGAPAQAVSAPLSNPATVATFTYSSGQTPENLALEPSGAVDVTFNKSAQVAQVNPSTGAVTVLATLPASTNGVAATADGIVRGTNGVLYVGYGAGNQSAIYMLDPTASDGLDNPSSVKISGSTVYLTNAAYFVQTNPSLMKATLGS
jgi:streptogramin lyase